MMINGGLKLALQGHTSNSIWYRKMAGIEKDEQLRINNHAHEGGLLLFHLNVW